MDKLLKTYAVGACVRISSLLVNLTIGFYSPYLLGVEVYGLCVACMALAIAAQGILEPTISSVLIGGIHGRSEQSKQQIESALGVAVCLLTLASLLGAFFTIQQLQLQYEIDYAALSMFVSLFTVLFIANTFLLGIAYSLNLPSLVIAANVSSSLVQIVGLPALKSHGTTGFFISLTMMQLTAVAVYLVKREVRQQFMSTLKQQIQAVNYHIGSEILISLSSRVALIVLNTASVLWVSFALTPSHAAALRVTITIIGCMKLVVPVSPELLQLSLRQGNGDPAVKRRVVKSLLYVFGICGLVAAICLPFLDSFRDAILTTSVNYPTLDLLILAAPFLYLITPFSSVMYACQQYRTLMISSVLCVSLFVVCGVMSTMPVAIVISSAAFVITMLAMFFASEHHTNSLLSNSHSQTQSLPPMTTKAA